MDSEDHQQIYYNGIIQEPVYHDDQYTFAIN